MFIDKPSSLFHAIEVWGHDIDYEPLRIPAPTEARPGSEEKVKVLQERLLAGEDLYHPDDASICATKEANHLLHVFCIGAAKKQRDINRAKGKKNGFAKANAVRKTLRTNRIRKKGCRS